MALSEIIAAKRRFVANQKKERPLRSFKDALRQASRSLRKALEKPHSGFVLECKRASPSRGEMRTDYDPVAITTCYAQFADAISVLTDETFFKGHLEHLRDVADTVQVPVLCKDFIVDAYQIHAARDFGADAVLLMLSVLSDTEYMKYSDSAAEFGMGVLTEVHDEAELARALDLDARIIGINNRNLETLSVDLGVVERLAPLVPAERLVVCESGITSRDQVRRLHRRVDGFLVGSSLMTAADIRSAAAELIYGRVKICGITSVEDAKTSAAFGATWGGLIFAASPRNVTPRQAESICTAVPELTWVGVFVNERIERVADLANRLRLGAVQLHGDESPLYVLRLKTALPEGCEIWKVRQVGDRLPPLHFEHTDRVVLDTGCREQRGGTGHRFDWSLLAGVAASNSVIIGGGIGPDNVAAVDALNPWGLDVNSRLELSPGVKHAGSIAALFRELRGTGRTATEPPAQRTVA